MTYLKRPSWWLGSLIIIVTFLASSQAVYADYQTSSFYDWGNYYQPKVLALTAHAQESSPLAALPPDVKVPTPSYLLPDNPFYFTKTLTENIQTAFTFGTLAKERRYLDLAEERLAETLSLASKGKYDLAQRTAERFGNQIETLNTNLQFLPEGPKQDDLQKRVESFATQSLLVTQNSLASSSPTNSDIYRQVLSSSQDLADTIADVKKEPAITNDLTTSLQTLKSQGLLTTEESAKLYNLKSRTEVRSELEKLAGEGLFPPAEIVTLDAVVKESYPTEYTRSYNNARFNELRSFESYPRPDNDTSTRLADFRKNYQEGEPIPGEIRPYLVFVRLEDLAKKVDLNTLPEETEKELRSFYPESVNVNPTAQLPPTPLAIGSPKEEKKPRGDSAPEVATTENQPQPDKATIPKIEAETYLGKPSGFLPDSPFYFVKRFREGFQNAMTFNREEQIKQDIQHAQERLREADSLFRVGKEKLGVAYLKNYTTSIKAISEDLKKLPDQNKETVLLADRFEDSVAKANIVLERTLIPIPPTQKNELQKAIVATQDSLDTASDAQNKAPVPRFLADRLQDLKSTGILLPEEVAKITQAENRGQVREILRGLEDKGAFPPADSKKLDSGQQKLYPEDYNKLVEVRKIEELSHLRVVQNDIAQTQSLKKTVEDYKGQEETLKKSVDTVLIGDRVIDNNPALDKKIKELQAKGETKAQPPSESLLPKPTFVLPNSPFYFLKGWGENINEFTSFGFEAKQKVKLSQAQERLAEAKALLASGNESLASTTIERYKGEVKEIIANLKGNTTEETKAKIADVISQQAARDSLAIELLQLGTSTHAQGNVTEAVKEVTDLLDVASDIKKEPPIPEEVKSKIEALPKEMLPDDKKVELLATTTRGDARAKVETLVTQGLILPEDYKNFNSGIESFNTTEFAKVEELKKVQEIVVSEESQKTLSEKITKNEEITKKLVEFQKNFKPGDLVPEEIRPYVPLTRIDELTRTIRPDLVSLYDFPNRSDVRIAVASLQQEFKPTSEDLKRLEDFKTKKPTSALPPDLARIDALRFSLGVRTGAGPCYLPSPPFAPESPCPPPGAPLSVAPTVSYNFASGQGGQNYQVYGVGPKPVSSGVCPSGYHWMTSEGGWCMSDGGAYNPSGVVSSNNNTYYQPYNRQISAGPYNTTATPVYSSDPVSPYYASSGGPSSYGQGPKPTTVGTCPSGFHWMSDSGGWCMSNGVSYSSPQPATNPTQNLTQESCGPGYYWSGDKCYVNYSYNNPSSYNNPYYNPTFVPSDKNSGAPYYYGPAPTTYTTTPPPGTTPGIGPKPISPGVCPTGFHWMFSDGGWCMADAPTYTPSSPGSGSGSGSGSGGSCSTGYYWTGSSCAPTSYNPTVNLTKESCGPGYYWTGTTCVVTNSSYCGSGYYLSGNTCVANPASGGSGSGSSCGSGYYWTGSYCAVSSGGSGGGSTTTTGSCPAGFHWMYDSGGWCMSDSGGSSTPPPGSTTPTSPPPPTTSTSSGSCPSGYHWMSDSGGWCMADGGGSSSPATTPAPTPAPEPAPTAPPPESTTPPPTPTP